MIKVDATAKETRRIPILVIGLLGFGVWIVLDRGNFEFGFQIPKLL